MYTQTEHFMQKASEPKDDLRQVASVPKVSPLAMRSLLAYDWPGNVRELFAALESALIRSGGLIVNAQHLPPEVRSDTAGGQGFRYGPVASGDEKTAIEEALRKAGGAKQKAASMLGMGRTTLWRKMREYGLD